MAKSFFVGFFFFAIESGLGPEGPLILRFFGATAAEGGEVVVGGAEVEAVGLVEWRESIKGVELLAVGFERLSRASSDAGTCNF